MRAVKARAVRAAPPDPTLYMAVASAQPLPSRSRLAFNVEAKPPTYSSYTYAPPAAATTPLNRALARNDSRF